MPKVAPRIEDADVIMTVSGSPIEREIVKIGVSAPSRPHNGPMSLRDGDQPLAARRARAADRQKLRLKCGMQSEWIHEGVRERRWSPDDMMSNCDIM